MFRIGKTISWIFLVVFFIALASIATTFYESDKEEKAEIKNNQLFKKGGEVIETISNFIGSWATQRTESELIDRAGQLMENVQEIASNTDKFLPEEAKDGQDNPPVALDDVSDSVTSAFSDLVGEGGDLLNEGKNVLADGESSDWKDKLSETKFWEYRKNDKGAEIVLSSKNGQEYIIPLPFKFLSEN